MTVADICARPDLAPLSADTVLGWIHSGELKARNVATKAGGRPSWRISEADLAEFLERRTVKARTKGRAGRPVRASHRRYWDHLPLDRK